MTVIHTPPGFDRAALLSRLNSAALEHSPEYRRAITRTSPTLFALVYLIDYLRGDETGNEVSLSRLHVDMARAARRWVRNDVGPGEIRDAWIAPRGSAKTVWACLILPLWAMAHGHPAGRFVHLFTDADEQARKHLRSLRDELAHNELLGFDFPQLCRPRESRAELYVAESGVAMAAAGLSKSTLGVRLGRQRPSLLLVDDPEPEAGDYDATTKERRLSAVQNKVLPMALNAPLCWTGTTTVHGGLAHDLVRAAAGQETAAWVKEMGIVPRYYPAIERDDEGRERSMWPQRWSLPWLRSIRGTRMFAMNYELMPPDAEHGFWSQRDITVDAGARAGVRVLMIDPAVTSSTRSDFTGLAVVGREPGGKRRAVVDYARGFRLSPEGLRRTVAGLLGQNRSVRRVRVEAVQGGDFLRDALADVCEEFMADLDLYRVHEHKAVRIARCLDHYQRGEVVHSRSLPDLTQQQLAYPNVAHDDVVDAVSAGVEFQLA